MCGLAGIILTPNRTLPDIQHRLQAMQDVMTHRGPDDAGLYLSPAGRVGLANRRLAIRDLTQAGHMPMTNTNGTVTITYNGEIYNAGELRRELESLGHTFRSTSDTEVILHGYEAWGEDVVERLRGMFAFAILDSRQGNKGIREKGIKEIREKEKRDKGRSSTPSFGQPEHSPFDFSTFSLFPSSTFSLSPFSTLFLARDRLGIKPLYYAQTPEGFVFASELKAVLASGLVGRQVSPAAAVAYLMLGSVPCPMTIYEGVRALEPGCTLSLEVGERPLSPVIRRYWELPADTVEPSRSTDVVERVRRLLEEAVRVRLVSDVPLGAFLSGGLDSSSVVALMRAVTDGPIRTCSMVFEEAAYSEAAYARAVADAVGAEHYERVITAGDVLNELDRILWAMDQPTIDGVNTYFVSQTAREAGLTVALSGLGGDELFGGYPNTFRGVPQMLRALHLAHRVPAGPSIARTVLNTLPIHNRWTKVADALSRTPSPASAYLTRRGLFAPREVQALVRPEVWEAAVEVFDPVAHIAGTREKGKKGIREKGNKGIREAVRNTQYAIRSAQYFSWVSKAELTNYTRNQLLRDTDVMSMAHSLEVRVPLLDHRLVEAVLRLPATAKLNGVGPKALLVEAVGDLLPSVVRDRREKRGFVFPFDVWLRGPLRDRSLEWQHSLDGWLQTDQVAKMHRIYEAGKLHWSRPWALAVLGGWVSMGRAKR